MHRSCFHIRPRGVSLIEAVISTAILALCVATIFQGLNFGYYSSLRATRVTESLARVTKRLEDINYIPYDSVTSNMFPVEYVCSTSATAIALVYAMTTSVRTVLLPIEYKVVTIDYAWRVRDSQRAARYFTIKTP
ncbi:MAG: hypothetical protein NTV22_17370 [bacterium]|nr:hypothetical protein [bacterium]